MKLWKFRKIVIVLLLMDMSTVFGQHTNGGEQSSDLSTNEEAHRLTAGWKFVRTNKNLFGKKNLTSLSVFNIEDFKNEVKDVNRLEGTPIRILKPKEGHLFLGFIDLDRNTYNVVEKLNSGSMSSADHISDYVAGEYGSDALIGIQSSAQWESAQRFIVSIN